jgi:hypothetical protein
MLAGRSLSLAAVLLSVALIAGCGSSSSSNSTSTNSSSTAASASTAASKPASTPTVPSAASVGSFSAAQLAQALATCKSVIHKDPTLSSSLKSKVEGICNKAASGNLAGARAAAKEVCLEIINGSPIPAGPYKQEAQAACAKE